MIRTVLFLLLVCGALLLAVYGYFALKENKKPERAVIDLFPAGCRYYFHCRDLTDLEKKLNGQNLVIDNLQNLLQIARICKGIHAVDSVIQSSALITEQLSAVDVHLAVYPGSEWLCGFTLTELGMQDKIGEELVRLLNAAKSSNGYFRFRMQKANGFFDLRQGQVLFANSEKILDRANDDGDKFIRSSAYRRYSGILAETNLLSLFSEKNENIKGNDFVAPFLPFSNGLAVGDLALEPTQLTLHGFAIPARGEYFSKMSGAGSLPADLPAAQLPASAVYFKVFAGDSSLPLVGEQFWDSVNRLALFNVRKEFADNLAGLSGHFRLQHNPKTIAFLHISDTLKADQHMQLMGDSAARNPMMTSLRNDELRFTQPGTSMKAMFIARSHSTLYLSEDSLALLQCIRELRGELTLSGNKDYTEYANEHFPETFNYLYYWSPALYPEAMEKNPELFADTALKPENLRHLCCAMTANGSDFSYRIHLQYEKKKAEASEEQYLWSSTLDTTASMKPAQFVNHRTGENEIFVQDLSNKIYLFNAKGTLIWKARIREQITSPVVLVDVFKTNKVQMLFSSKNYIHLLDRNGKYVEGFPVRLPSEASAGLSVFDYENNKEYRLLIPCTDRKVYCYSVAGKQLEGFAPLRTDRIVKTPVQYQKVGDKDYLFALDEEGRIYIFGRKGNLRLNLKNRTVVNCSSYYVHAGSNEKTSFLMYVDEKNNLINRIYLNDRKEIGKITEENSIQSVEFAFVDENRSIDVVVAASEGVYAYDQQGGLLLKKEPPANLAAAGFYTDETMHLLYGLSPENRTLYVYEQNANRSSILEASSLPLISDLFKDNKKFLIVSSGNQLRCKSLN